MRLDNMKPATLKTKRGSVPLSNNAQKGHSAKQKKGVPKSRLVKSTPGFSLYAGDDVTKPGQKPKDVVVAQPKGPRLMNGDPLGAVSHEDNIVSQVQIVESKSKEGMLHSRVDVKINRPKVDKVRATSPDLSKMPGPPEVRTPFNKRLISSTPDPERLFSTLDDDDSSMVLSKGNPNVDMPGLSLSPQMVPEKDDTKSSPTFDVISSMLQAQRQNQILWQQQLEQFKHPPVMKVRENPSAFQQWKGSDHVVSDGNDREPVLLPHERRFDCEEEKNFHKAEWVAGDTCQPEQKNDSSKSSNDSKNNDQVSPFAYNSFGASSGPVKVKVEEIVTSEKPLSQIQDSVITVQAKSNDSKQSEMKRKTFPFKSKEETVSHRNKIPTSARSLKTSATGVKVLPASTHNVQEGSRFQPKTNANRKLLNKKRLQDKVAIVPESTEPAQKKKVLHVNLPRDERGMDLPPSFSSSDSDSDHDGEGLYSTPEPLGTKDDKRTLANDSVSTCGEEVTSLLSKESDRSVDDPSTVVEADIKGKQSTDTSVEKDGVAYTLLDKGGLQLNNIGDGIATVDSCDVKNANENDEVKDLAEQNVQGSVEIELRREFSKSPKDVTEEKIEGDESEAVNTNQNYHDSFDDDGDRRGGSKRYRLHFLEKMADKTLMDIVCKLTLKATAIRDVELRDLIDDMVYNTDATLAREDGRFRSSQAFFMEENGRLKKRLHNVNKQLEAKERQERQASLYPGISNNDVMHLERKNLYLRQEKERLDNQVTNLLEEKARWLGKQQDLVKTISMKDREILKLEGKFQEEKKILHKAVDEAAKNSQGVHFKLSVADREISNLEQRVKAKDREISDLKDTLKDTKDDLQCCLDSRTEKNREIQRLQDMVNTLKVGVDEVMQAYESTAHSQPSTAEQRKGIESLRQLVTDSLSVASSLSLIPERAATTTGDRIILSQPNDGNDRRRAFTVSSSVRQEMPPPSNHHPHHHQQQHQRHHHHHSHSHRPPQLQEQQEQPRGRQQQHTSQTHKHSHPDEQRHRQSHPSKPTQPNTQAAMTRDHHAQRSPRRQQTQGADGVDGDWYTADSSLIKNRRQRSRHGSGSALTVQALEDHNRRLSPIDRTLWHSLDTGHVMPPFAGEEPYHSDSEIHVANSRRRKRMEDEERMKDMEFGRTSRHLQQDRRWQRRRSDDFTDRQELWRCRECVPVESRQRSDGRLNRSYGFDDGIEGRRGERDRRVLEDEMYEIRSRDYEPEMVVDETVRNFEDGPGEELVEELESVTLHDEDNDSNVDRSRYSVSDYFKKYPPTSTARHSSSQRPGQQESEKGFNSKDYWVDSGTADDQDPGQVQSRSMEKPRSFQHAELYPSLESVSIGQNVPPSVARREFTDPREGPAFHLSTQRQQHIPEGVAQRLLSHGKVLQTHGSESQSRHGRGHPDPNTLSSSYPTLQSQGVSSTLDQPSTMLYPDSQFPALLSTSLPASSHHRDRSNRGFDNDNQLLPSSMLQPHQQDYQRSRDKQDQSSYRPMESTRDGGMAASSSNRNDRRYGVTFREPSTEDSITNQPSQSFQSDFLNGRTSFPPHSSPVNTSDISLSRRATRGSETSQQDFFRGTELSASYSSISDTDIGHPDYSNSNNAREGPTTEYGEESFNTGIASLDSKIADLEAKINRTKAVFS